MVVVDVKVAHDQTRPSLVEVNLDSVVLHLHHPEYVVRVDVHVEFVNLLGKVCRSNRTGVQVESNKGERTPMGASVRTDELALAKAHVRLIREWHCGACSSVRSGPAAADVRQTHDPVEVVDLRWVANARHRHAGSQRVMVDNNPERFEWGAATGNWTNNWAMALLLVILLPSIGRIGT